jgi:hypothetical protein
MKPFALILIGITPALVVMYPNQRTRFRDAFHGFPNRVFTHSVLYLTREI